MTTLSVSMSRRAPLIAQALAALIAGLLLFFGAIIIWVLGYQLLYAGRIFPGVTVAGVSVSGLSPDNAALKLSETFSYPISGKVVFRNGDRALGRLARAARHGLRPIRQCAHRLPSRS